MKNNDVLKIGIFGVDILSMNKGVSALGISLVSILKDILNSHDKKYKFYFFENSNPEVFKILVENLGLDKNDIILDKLSLKKISDLIRLNKQLKKMDYVVDITGGDSFSDIYGKKWMLRSSLVKVFTLLHKKKLILAPQTYGPFESIFAKKVATFILNNAYSVMSRDEMSINEISELTKKKVNLSTDVAFLLPYHKSYSQDNNHGKKRIGINVSQLLWSGGYTNDNQFGLKVNYQKYITSIIDNLIDQKRYDIYLIPHVVREDRGELIDKIENDLVASKEILNMYEGNIKVAPVFETPIEAKTFISNMDIFIGSRMHATIASFSTGVPTIPIAYSRKFEGLFSNLDYNYVIDATELSTEDAIKNTLIYINDISKLRESVEMSKAIIEKNIEKMRKDFSNALLEDLV